MKNYVSPGSTHSLQLTFTALCISFIAMQQLQAAPQAKIKVTLFGQACNLVGPYSEATLQEIHAVSPEKIPVDFTASQVQNTLDLLKKIQRPKIPSALEPYLDRQKSRFEGWSAFYAVLKEDASKRTSEELLTRLKPHLKNQNPTPLKELADRWSKDWANGLMREQFVEGLRERLPADPEAEFHRVIRRLKIKYTCTFEE